MTKLNVPRTGKEWTILDKELTLLIVIGAQSSPEKKGFLKY